MQVLTPSTLARLWAQLGWSTLGPVGQELFSELNRFFSSGSNQLLLATDDEPEISAVPPSTRIQTGNVRKAAERYELKRTKSIVDQLGAQGLAWCSTAGRRKRGERTEFDVHGDGIHALSESERHVRVPAPIIRHGNLELPSQYVVVHTICAACRKARERDKVTKEVKPHGRLIMLDRCRRGIYSTDEDNRLRTHELGDLRPRLVKLHGKDGNYHYFLDGTRIELTMEWDGGYGMVPTVELSGSELSDFRIEASPLIIALVHRPWYQISILQGGNYYRLYLRNT